MRTTTRAKIEVELESLEATVDQARDMVWNMAQIAQVFLNDPNGFIQSRFTMIEDMLEECGDSIDAICRLMESDGSD